MENNFEKVSLENTSDKVDSQGNYTSPQLQETEQLNNSLQDGQVSENAQEEQKIEVNDVVQEGEPLDEESKNPYQEGGFVLPSCEKEEHKKESVGSIITTVILGLFCAILIFVKFFWIYSVQVVGDSMNDTLQSGDYLYVDKLADINRGDVIVFTLPDGSGEGAEGRAYIKRVIATAGDTVLMKDGNVYLKKAGEDHFEIVEYEGVKGLTYYRAMDHSFPFEFTVSENHVYVLGDNRENSRDSRVLGEINLDNVDGVVTSFMIERKDGKLGDFCGWFYQTRKSIHDFLFGEE